MPVRSPAPKCACGREMRKTYPDAGCDGLGFTGWICVDCPEVTIVEGR